MFFLKKGDGSREYSSPGTAAKGLKEGEKLEMGLKDRRKRLTHLCRPPHLKKSFQRQAGKKESEELKKKKRTTQ